MIKDFMVMQHLILHTIQTYPGAIVLFVDKFENIKTVIGYCFASGCMYNINL